MHFNILTLLLVFSLNLPAFSYADGKTNTTKNESAHSNAVPLFKKLNLKEGDTIKTINGKAIKSGDGAEELSALMKTADKIEIEVLRGGKIEKIIYEVK